MALWSSGETISRDKFNTKSVFVGASEPATKFAGQVWVDTTLNVVKFRDAGNAFWIVSTTGLHYSPTGIEFGSATQEYDISGVTWVSAAAGGALGGIPNEATANHKLADCLAAILTSRDLTYLNVREKTGAASATNPLTVQFLFSNVLNFDTIEMRSYYIGSPSHDMSIQLWNYTTNVFDTFAMFSGETGYITRAITVFNHASYVSAGVVKLQVIHTSSGLATHSIQFDYVTLGIGSGTGGTSLASSVQYTGAGIFATKTNVQTALDEINTTYLDQALKQASSPIFVGLTLSSAVSGVTTLGMNGLLTLSGDTTTNAGGILFHDDTYLYRSGANALTTDGNLTVAGDVECSTGATGIILKDVAGNRHRITLANDHSFVVTAL